MQTRQKKQNGAMPKKWRKFFSLEFCQYGYQIKARSLVVSKKSILVIIIQPEVTHVAFFDACKKKKTKKKSKNTMCVTSG